MAELENYVNDPRYSQVFHLPADPAAGRAEPFKVTYADYGYRDESRPGQESVLLFFPPLMGSRLLHIAKDALAKRHRIRVISLDRPGFGGTGPAEAQDRLALWSEVIVALLAHLEIRHVSIACHSGGTVYALDLLLNHPELLDPENAYLAIGAPWILPDHSNVISFRALQALPSFLIGYTDKLATYTQSYISPLIGRSIGLSQAIVNTVYAPSQDPQSDLETEVQGPEDLKLEKKLWPKIIERVFADGIEGMSADAVLLLHKETSWGTWGDYDTLVPRFGTALAAMGRRLRVDVFYAESDALIGSGLSQGASWFDQCWRSEECSTVEHRSRVVNGADHDAVWDLDLDAIQQVIRSIGESGEDREDD